MTKPTISELYTAVDRTWPPFEIHEHNGWHIREGKGGGKRVSAATRTPNATDFSDASKFQLSLGQDDLFMIQEADQDLDAALAMSGYELIDPVVFLGKPIDGTIETQGSGITVSDAPTSIQAKLWKASGINQSRLNVMMRAPKRACISIEDKAVAFTAIHEGIAMTHALEVAKKHRRQGLGTQIMDASINWAAQNCADWIVVLTVLENQPARSLYTSMGMVELGFYHYRLKP